MNCQGKKHTVCRQPAVFGECRWGDEGPDWCALGRSCNVHVVDQEFKEPTVKYEAVKVWTCRHSCAVLVARRLFFCGKKNPTLSVNLLQIDAHVLYPVQVPLTLELYTETYTCEVIKSSLGQGSSPYKLRVVKSKKMQRGVVAKVQYWFCTCVAVHIIMCARAILWRLYYQL